MSNMCAQRRLHRQPGVRVDQLVAEELLELVDPVPDARIRDSFSAAGGAPATADALEKLV